MSMTESGVTTRGDLLARQVAAAVLESTRLIATWCATKDDQAFERVDPHGISQARVAPPPNFTK